MNVYQRALQAYKNTLNDLTVMGLITETVYESRGQKFDSSLLLEQFDIILQYSMLQLALADGRLSLDELQFIKDLTDKGDLCEFLKEEGFSNATWYTLYSMDEAKISKILNDCKSDMKKVSHDFTVMFSSFSLNKGAEYLTSLKNDISDVLIAIISADGKRDKKEIDQINDCLIVDVVCEIETIVARLRK